MGHGACGDQEKLWVRRGTEREQCLWTFDLRREASSTIGNTASGRLFQRVQDEWARTLRKPCSPFKRLSWWTSLFYLSRTLAVYIRGYENKTARITPMFKCVDNFGYIFFAHDQLGSFRCMRSFKPSVKASAYAWPHRQRISDAVNFYTAFKNVRLHLWTYALSHEHLFAFSCPNITIAICVVFTKHQQWQ